MTHLFDMEAMLLISNALIILATIALSYYTAKAANETARQIHKDDNRVIRALIRKNKAARHARRVEKAKNATQHDDNVWRIS